MTEPPSTYTFSAKLQSDPSPRAGTYRWRICALLFFATTIIYIDRQVFGILAPVLQKEIGWNEIQYGYIIAAFSLAYAFGMLFFGPIIDRIGTKLGYASSIFLWSVFVMGHALVRTVFGFGIARFLLGASESGNFPAATKTTAEWFPKKERAFALGWFNAGANVAPIVASAFVPWIALTWGWREAFIFTGLLGLIWILFWWRMYGLPEQIKRVSKEERAYIQSDQSGIEHEKIPWLKLLKYRQTWSFVAGKFLTDPVWWVYLYWLPKFLNQRFGLDLAHMGIPLIVIYTMTSVGSVGGGWLSGAFIKRGLSVDKSRKRVMLISALCVVPIIFVTSVSQWWAIVLLGLATASHQSWSTNLFTTVSDMFPKKAVGSVVGLGGWAGSLGGMLIATAAGFILQISGSYVPLFVVAGMAYLAAFFVINLFVPEMKEIEI